MKTKAEEILSRYWGYATFREGQWEIIEQILANRDVLAVLPTGGGKSICFQVPALLQDGVTLVVSPLIALMQDQVKQLNERGISAVSINSSQSRSQIDQLWTDVEFGQYKLVYVSPERLLSDIFLARASRLNIQFLAIDEAHCVSEWGHDFRPAYLRIPEAYKVMGRPPVAALTATATPPVRADMLNQLQLSDPFKLVKGFDRPNIVWSVFTEVNKTQKVFEIMDAVPGCGILYATTRKEVMRWVKDLGTVSGGVVGYHGGMLPADRIKNQEAWISGGKRIMVATNAFGMGIDKPDVRFVIHVAIPGSLEAYYQEAGRAGRDGAQSHAVLLYNQKDLDTQNYLIDSSHPPPDAIKKVYDVICDLSHIAVGEWPAEPVVASMNQLQQFTKKSSAAIGTSLQVLQQQGYWQSMPIKEQFVLLKMEMTMPALRAYAGKQPNRALDAFIDVLVRNLHADAWTNWWEVELRMLAQRAGLTVNRVEKGLLFLQEKGILSFLVPEEGIRGFLVVPRVGMLKLDKKALERMRKRVKNRLGDVQQYAERMMCRRRYLLSYFGEKTDDDCGTCDFCLGRHDGYRPGREDHYLMRRIMEGIQAGEGVEEWFAVDDLPAWRRTQLIEQLLRQEFIAATDRIKPGFELTKEGIRILKKEAS